MYFPKSQIQTNLYTNGNEFQKITTKEIYTGFYFKTSNGQHYTGKFPNDGENILLIKFNSDISKQFSPTPPLQPNLPPESQQLILPVTDTTDTPTDDNGNPYPNEIDTQKYSHNTVKRYLPYPSVSIPTPQEQNLGVYTRYFCKKNNELKYMEINKLTFDKLLTKSKDIAWDLYTPISTLWYLDGSDNVNENLISQIEREQKWYGFSQYFKGNFLS